MQLVIIANEVQEKELKKKGFGEGISVTFMRTLDESGNDTDVIMDLLFDNSTDRINQLKSYLPKLVLINAVIETLAEIQQPFIRINAWNGFLAKPIIEMVAGDAQLPMLQQLFLQLGWQYKLVPDVSGMISPRIISMVINEAWITYDAGISSKEEIDIAMKLGTNYPYGPFEWGNYLGMTNIKLLVTKLFKENNTYKVAASLQGY
jgi:3-hydroxybutyryl-CoA dehydrogenase